MRTKHQKSFFFKNSLSIVFLTLAVMTLMSQAISGWLEYNKFLKEHNVLSISLIAYFKTGHFVQATF